VYVRDGLLGLRGSMRTGTPIAPLVVLAVLQACAEGHHELRPCAGSAFLDVTADTVRIDGLGCGMVTFDRFEILGEGAMRLEFFTDTVSVVPQIHAEEDAVWTGLVAHGEWSIEEGKQPIGLLKQGYQSWSASGVFALGTAERDSAGVVVAGGDEGGLEVAAETPHTSWWMGMIGRDDGPSVAVGTLSARSAKFWVSFEEDGSAQAVWGHRGESVALVEGQDLYMDPLWGAWDRDPHALARRYADAVAELVPPRPLSDAPPVGWSTWYQYYADLSADDVRANLAVATELATQGGLEPMTVFQIDDGWSISWGDWRPNERFGDSMAPLAEDIRAAGLQPGLWMAPFYVHVSAPAYLEHPDWWVRNREGDEVGYLDHRVIDVTHPEAAAWLQEQISDRVAEGFDYLKLDFLYAGAQEGRRHESVTGMEAYRIGTELIRAAAPDAWILACGAPLLPSVGFAESYRSGPDIAFNFDPDPRRPFLRSQMRSTTARGWANGRWWWNDPDPLLVREPLPFVEVSGTVASAVASGGAWLLGDDLAQLSDDRLALSLDAGVVGLRGADVRPAALWSHVSGFDTTPVVEAATPDDAVPVIWRLSTGETVLLNLSDQEVQARGPGGTELLSGQTASAGMRALAPGAGEVWRPSR
jgi:hypothetical protein